MSRNCALNPHICRVFIRTETSGHESVGFIIKVWIVSAVDFFINCYLLKNPVLVESFQNITKKKEVLISCVTEVMSFSVLVWHNSNELPGDPGNFR